MPLTLEHLNELWGEPTSHYPLDLRMPLGNVCTDSRKLVRGDFFVPLVGEKFNAHYINSLIGTRYVWFLVFGQCLVLEL